MWSKMHQPITISDPFYQLHVINFPIIFTVLIYKHIGWLLTNHNKRRWYWNQKLLSYWCPDSFIARLSVSMVLAMQGKQFLVVQEEWFCGPMSSQCRKRWGHTNMVLCFLNLIWWYKHYPSMLLNDKHQIVCLRDICWDFRLESHSCWGSGWMTLDGQIVPRKIYEYFVNRN